MTVTVYKETVHLSEIGPDDKVHLKLPAGAEILTVAEQYEGSGSVAIWYRCEASSPKVDRFIHVVGTGHPAPVKADAPYLSTVILNGGGLVLHFFGDGRLL